MVQVVKPLHSNTVLHENNHSTKVESQKSETHCERSESAEVLGYFDFSLQCTLYFFWQWPIGNLIARIMYHITFFVFCLRQKDYLNGTLNIHYSSFTRTYSFKTFFCRNRSANLKIVASNNWTYQISARVSKVKIDKLPKMEITSVMKAPFGNINKINWTIEQCNKN